MTILELATRDYKKASINYLRAAQRTGTPPDELAHMEELRELRYRIMLTVQAATGD